jgi:hypothetical protein
VPRLRRSCILAEKTLAHTSLHPSWGSLRNVPVHAGRVRDWQQILISIQGKARPANRASKMILRIIGVMAS